MNNRERESIILDSAWQMIDGMVNWALFEKDDRTRPSCLMFKSSVHSRLFIILLGDFLSDVRVFKGQPPPLGLKPVPSNARPADLTFLYHLRQVCANPTFGADTTHLTAAIENFASWLEGEFLAPQVNLSSIDVVADIRIARYRYIKMCADIAKHNLARLSNNVRHLRELLGQAGHPVTDQQASLAIEGFFEWFHDDIFNYHSSKIAEALNNIRWAMFDYLQPEFSRAYQPRKDSPRYTYLVPRDIANPLAYAMYWDLMNRVRSKPVVVRFSLSEPFGRY